MESIKFEVINDLTIRTHAHYSDVFALVKEKIVSLGGQLKRDAEDKGILEGKWRYGINPWGLRVTVKFRTIDESTIEMVFKGGFKDSFDSTGAGKKKATELLTTITSQTSPNSRQEAPEGMPPMAADSNANNRAKSKTTAGLLAIFLGGAGVHKFYLGNWGIGIIFLISMFIVPGLSVAIALIEAIRIFSLEEEKFDEKYNDQDLKPFQAVW